jgi:hypothetical protein
MNRSQQLNADETIYIPGPNANTMKKDRFHKLITCEETTFVNFDEYLKAKDAYYYQTLRDDGEDWPICSCSVGMRK